MYRHDTQLTMDANELLLQFHKADPLRGNASLQRAVGIGDGRYERAKSRLIELGLARRGTGSGGSLLRADSTDGDGVNRGPRVKPAKAREARLYEPLSRLCVNTGAARQKSRQRCLSQLRTRRRKDKDEREDGGRVLTSCLCESRSSSSYLAPFSKFRLSRSNHLLSSMFLRYTRLWHTAAQPLIRGLHCRSRLTWSTTWKNRSRE